MISKPTPVSLDVQDIIKITATLVGCIVLLYVLAYLSTFIFSKSEERSSAKKRLGGWTNLWLAFTAAIHIVFDGPYGLLRDTYFLKKGLDLYAMADFRYAQPMEPGTIVIEVMTGIFTAPVIVLNLFAVVNNLWWRHPIQIVGHTMQYYGLVWYTMQPFYEKDECFSDDPLYFYGLGVLMNLPWVIFPPIMIYQSFGELKKIISGNKVNGVSSKNGKVKGE